jgi:hypothetical protein
VTRFKEPSSTSSPNAQEKHSIGLLALPERFVALCSLGLEATSADEIRKILLRYQLTLDTDIVLTFLCAGEPDHEAATELLNRWLNIRGEITVAPTMNRWLEVSICYPGVISHLLQTHGLHKRQATPETYWCACQCQNE